MILDTTDLRLLHFLQQDGRISNQELAEKVALSPSACLRRLRLLESEGIISGYRAVLNAEQLRNLLHSAPGVLRLALAIT